MRIVVLGTRGEIEESAPYHAKKSGVLIDDVLLDVGDKRFLEVGPRAILITHFHPDHAYFVRTHESPHFSMPVYAPEEYGTMSIKVPRKPFKIGSLRITPIPTIHSALIKSQAYLIERGRKKVLYTGDMIWIEKKYHRLLRDVDLVITEASFMRRGGVIRRNKKNLLIYGHTGVPNLISLFERFTRRMLFMHFGAWFYKDMKRSRSMFKELAREHDVEIDVGYDGMALEI